MQFEVVLQKPEKDTAVLKVIDENNAALTQWLQRN